MAPWATRTDRPFIIAEIGGNHEGNFAEALRLAALALATQADAVKFQVYAADTIVSPVADPAGNAHFRKFALTDIQYSELAALCGKRFCASVWSEAALALVDPWVGFHKVGSGDLTNYPLLRRIAERDKPLIVSTAMATLVEVEDAIAWIDRANPRLRQEGDLCLLHCVAMYGDPKPEYARLNALRVLQRRFPDLPIGYSDHTVGAHACELAIAMGARVIEKHFTTDKTRSFRDHAIAMTADEFDAFAEKAAKITSMLGPQMKEPVAAIEDSRRIASFRRSVCAARELEAGVVLGADMLVTLRPLVGVDARRFDDVLGRRLLTAKRAHEPIFERDLE